MNLYAPDNRLQVPLADAFAGVPRDWQAVTAPFIASPAGQGLCTYVDARVRAGAAVYPAHVFRALDLTTPGAVRVVILGQDPYHGAGQAQGLAFSVAAGSKLPPSLRNILAEVREDTGAEPMCRDDLSAWATQGVLLLNTTLTVEEGHPQSHAGRGWERLTDALIAHVSAQPRPVVFMLWGASAQSKASLVDTTRHVVLRANHPSPLSARRPPVPFIGCRHFSQAAAALVRSRPDEPPLRW